MHLSSSILDYTTCVYDAAEILFRTNEQGDSRSRIGTNTNTNIDTLGQIQVQILTHWDKYKYKYWHIGTNTNIDTFGQIQIQTKHINTQVCISSTQLYCIVLSLPQKKYRHTNTKPQKKELLHKKGFKKFTVLSGEDGGEMLRALLYLKQL